MRWLVTAVDVNRRSRKREGKGRQRVFVSSQTEPAKVEREYERLYSEGNTVCKVVDVRLADGEQVGT